jgi:hypothetical protein
MLESVFPPGDLVTLAGPGRGAALDAVPHQPARAFLREVGLPDKSWFEVSTALRDGEPRVGFDVVAQEFPELDFAFERWMLLGHLGWDTIALDTATGQVFVVPNGETPHLLGSSLDQFVNVLYLLEVERPNYDFVEPVYDEDDDEDEDDLPAYDPDAPERLRAQIAAADPAAFATPDSTWDLVLLRITEGY